MVAYAGEVPSAHDFWEAFSNKIAHLNDYDPSRRVDRSMLDAILQAINVPTRLAILGVLTDQAGTRAVYRYGDVVTAETRCFGTCYFAGSGTPSLERMVPESDAAWSGAVAAPRNMSLTEELAESISSRVLFMEAALSPSAPDYPVSRALGGFVEWYKIEPDGVRPQRERLEIHIQKNNDTVSVGGIYLVGSVRLEVSPTLGSNLSIVSFHPQSTEIHIEDVDGRFLWVLSSLNGHGTLIEPSLPYYDRSAEDKRNDRLDGPISIEDIYRIHGQEPELRRVTLVVHNNVRLTTQSIVNQSSEPPLAWVGATDGQPEIVVDDLVTRALLKRIGH